MGQVWLAEQTGAVKRQVALKVVKAGRFDYSALQRFNLERQSLATMNHPAIAKVFDADSTPDGQPYGNLHGCLGNRTVRKHDNSGSKSRLLPAEASQ
jgi:serine/threonine protein kinase